MTERPDYVHCVKPHESEFDTFCGRNVAFLHQGKVVNQEWLFQDAGHAVLTARANDRPMICPECAAEMIRLIQQQTYTP